MVKIVEINTQNKRTLSERVLTSAPLRVLNCPQTTLLMWGIVSLWPGALIRIGSSPGQRMPGRVFPLTFLPGIFLTLLGPTRRIGFPQGNLRLGLGVYDALKGNTSQVSSLLWLVYIGRLFYYPIFQLRGPTFYRSNVQTDDCRIRLESGLDFSGLFPQYDSLCPLPYHRR